MATRRNLITNPCLSVSNAGWGGGSTPTRQTGLTGFVRTTGARYTTGTFVLSQSAAVTVGLAYTVSVYVKPASFGWSGTIYAEFYNSGGGAISSPSTGFTANSGVVTRVSLANSTAPANAVTVKIVLDGENFSGNNCDITAALIEQAATLQAYFDGDSPGAVWDGTTGLSSSTLADAVTRPPQPMSQYAGYF